MKHRKIEDSEFEGVINSEIENILDWQLLILKGHILIEYSLNKFINDYSADEFDIYNEHFQFSQKLKICKAIGLFKHAEHHSLEGILISFNRVRNSIAHYLDYNEIELQNVISSFKKMSLSVLPIEEGLDDFEVLKKFIVAVCALIVGIKMKLERYRRFNVYVIEEYRALDEASFSKKFEDFQ